MYVNLSKWAEEEEEEEEERFTLQPFSPFFFLSLSPRSFYPCFSLRSLLQLTCLGGKRGTMAGSTHNIFTSLVFRWRRWTSASASPLLPFPWLELLPGRTQILVWGKERKGLLVMEKEGKRFRSGWLVLRARWRAGR